jgi:hypothetical protein
MKQRMNRVPLIGSLTEIVVPCLDMDGTEINAILIFTQPTTI